MDIRKILLSVIFVFALSMSFQPAGSLIIFKEITVLSVDTQKDGSLRDFIENNRKKSFAVIISLTAAVYQKDSAFNYFFNDS